MRAGVVGNQTSATWELFTSARDAHDAAWGSVPDFNGDGLADWTLGAFGANPTPVAAAGAAVTAALGVLILRRRRMRPLAAE